MQEGMNKFFKTKILVKSEKPIKMIFNNYQDAFFIIITQNDKIGSMVKIFLRKD